MLICILVICQTKNILSDILLQVGRILFKREFLTRSITKINKSQIKARTSFILNLFNCLILVYHCRDFIIIVLYKHQQSKSNPSQERECGHPNWSLSSSFRWALCTFWPSVGRGGGPAKLGPSVSSGRLFATEGKCLQNQAQAHLLCSSVFQARFCLLFRYSQRKSELTHLSYQLMTFLEQLIFFSQTGFNGMDSRMWHDLSYTPHRWN